MKFLGCVAGLLFAGVANSAEQLPTAPPAAVMNRAMKPIVYRVPQMDRVVVHSDLKYSNLDDPMLRMDVYVPPDLSANDRRPMVLLIHGGVPAALPVKNMGAYRSWGRLIAAHGMVAFTFNHRLRWPLGQLEEGASDVRAAIDFARSNAAKFNADADRVCVAAWSAGGPLLTVPLQDEPKYVRCALAFYPLVDLNGFDGKNLEQFSIATSMRKPNFVPLFVARAGRDTIPTLNERLDRFVAEALVSNAPIVLMNHPDGTHGFDVDNDDERSRYIIGAALAFMNAHLSASAPKM